MEKSILARYVLDGGWTMVLLLPAAVAAVATALRAGWVLRRANVRAIADQLYRSDDADSAAIAYAAALRLYGALQPLSALYVLAPLLGMLGSLVVLLSNESGLAVADLRRAILPPVWGVGIAIFSYLCFVLLRARLVAVERDIFLPAARKLP